MLLTLFPDQNFDDTFICADCQRIQEVTNKDGYKELHCSLFAVNYPELNFDKTAVCIKSCSHVQLSPNL